MFAQKLLYKNPACGRHSLITCFLFPHKQDLAPECVLLCRAVSTEPLSNCKGAILFCALPLLSLWTCWQMAFSLQLEQCLVIPQWKKWEYFNLYMLYEPLYIFDILVLNPPGTDDLLSHFGYTTELDQWQWFWGSWSCFSLLQRSFPSTVIYSFLGDHAYGKLSCITHIQLFIQPFFTTTLFKVIQNLGCS